MLSHSVFLLPFSFKTEIHWLFLINCWPCYAFFVLFFVVNILTQSYLSYIDWQYFFKHFLLEYFFSLQLMIHKCKYILGVHIFSFFVTPFSGECVQPLLQSLMFLKQCCGRLHLTSLSVPNGMKFFYCNFSPIVSWSYFSSFRQLVRLEFQFMCLIWQTQFSRCWHMLS